MIIANSCIILVHNYLNVSFFIPADDDNARDMYEIHFADNSLTNITYMGSFYYLTYLDVSSNHISYIEEAAFRDLRYLEKLNLESNRITIITEEHFKGLTSLKVL